MKNLIKFELRKILTKRFAVISVAAVLLLSLIPGLLYTSCRRIAILLKVTIWLSTVITLRAARCLERWRITSPRAFMRNTRIFSLIPSQSRQSMKSSLCLRLWRTVLRDSDTTTLLMRRMRKILIPMSGSARSLLCMIQV